MLVPTACLLYDSKLNHVLLLGVLQCYPQAQDFIIKQRVTVSSA